MLIFQEPLYTWIIGVIFASKSCYWRYWQGKPGQSWNPHLPMVVCGEKERMSLPHMTVSKYKSLLHPWFTTLKPLTLEIWNHLESNWDYYRAIPVAMLFQSRKGCIKQQHKHIPVPMQFLPNTPYNAVNTSTRDTHKLRDPKKYVPETKPCGW